MVRSSEEIIVHPPKNDQNKKTYKKCQKTCEIGFRETHIVSHIKIDDHKGRCKGKDPITEGFNPWNIVWKLHFWNLLNKSDFGNFTVFYLINGYRAKILTIGRYIFLINYSIALNDTIS